MGVCRCIVRKTEAVGIGGAQGVSRAAEGRRKRGGGGPGRFRGAWRRRRNRRRGVGCAERQERWDHVAPTPRATSELSAGRSHTAGREGGGASEGVSLSRWLPQCGEEPPRPFLGPCGPFCPSRGHVHLTNEGRRCGWFSKAIKTPVEGEFSFSLSTRLEILRTL